MNSSRKMTMARSKAEVVDIAVDCDRIVASIAYAIATAENKEERFTQYDVVKSLFLADRAHLNRFGRLVTNDTYVAMIHGPVPSVAYDLLKENPWRMRYFEINELPWKSKSIGEGKREYFHADASWVDDFLSPSDKAAIEDAVTTVSSLSFGQIRKLTHEDAAYIDAWEDEAERKQFPMSLGLLFDTPNFEKAREIRDVSRL
ncbi:DUF4065 domain-containing protein [Agrobacterium tumefaciens]|uniref:DUF4065 domain-containing protein n=2 Tax=Agrobacterium tumefaciens TaxID=358 RepID=A0A546XRY9_AGRTU|nr:DUF4065 domain-containing protein [Agrobacterium tumefaciens]